MTDVLTRTQRSYNMSRIRGKWTSQEKLVHNYLKGRKIQHKMHPPITGKPDILLGEKTVVFLDGCFWHKCPKCFKMPATRKEFWKAKINRNVLKDRETSRILKKQGYKVVRIWEHDLHNLQKSRRKLLLKG
jgi:DNA mismatch endonuclease (patch repair protein)